MIELRGKYNSAKVYNDFVEETAVGQIINFLNHEAFQHGNIAIMPDVHAGAGAVIGFTAPLGNKVIPNVVGVDIGCGVCSWKLGQVDEDFENLEKFIQRVVPSGFSVRTEKINFKNPKFRINKSFLEQIKELCERTEQDHDRVLYSIGSLGGGNHFIEIGKDGNGECWLAIHSGSRNFGLKVATWHQKKAIAKVGKMGGLAYLEDDAAGRYLEDMNLAQIYAHLNRKVMGYYIVEKYFNLNVDKLESIESVHNYISFGDKIIRKGAISAHKNERVIIPMHMAFGNVIGRGKGNDDWNQSAPHGAGRRMSRRKAKEELKLEDVKEQMKDVQTWSLSNATLDEAPDAYKDPNEIIEYLKETVEVEDIIKPVYNFKAK